eukprot:CAMPEP_0170752868 /NCGR_PEP_ID=MMETSP0437-20130122/12192_1 /TAXON_ID=0 /ORGANISM="Sexangularia sp." /LENGTH=883 /DNA_ID=CAMNT_0011091955 /DNA_START=28 /DNA_END=2676 /DNA_ORIENTATION=-
MSAKRYIINAFIALSWVVNDEGPPSLPVVDCVFGKAAPPLDALLEYQSTDWTDSEVEPSLLHGRTIDLVGRFNEAVTYCEEGLAFLGGVGESPSDAMRGELSLAACVSAHRDLLTDVCSFPPSLHTLGVLAETASSSTRIELYNGEPDLTLRQAAQAAFLGAERAQRQLRLITTATDPATPLGQILAVLAPPASFISRAAASAVAARAALGPPGNTWGDRHFFRVTFEGLWDFAGTDDPLAGEARILLAQAATALDGPDASLRVLAADESLRVATVWAAACSVARQLTRAPEALIACQRAVVLNPTSASYRLSLADLQRSSVFPSLFNLTASSEQLTIARSLDPTSAAVVYSLAAVHSLAGHLDVAVSLWREAEALAGPDEVEVRAMALAERTQVQTRMADWSTRAQDLATLQADAIAALDAGRLPVISPWASLGLENFDATLVRRIATAYMGATVASTVGTLAYPPLPVDEEGVDDGASLAALDDVERVVRVGLVSADVGDTNVGHDLVGFFAGQRRSARLVEMFVYTPTPDDGSAWRAELVAAIGEDHLRFIGNASSDEAAALIRADAIDVLVNLNGFVKYARNDVFALRPAPVQVVYKGYPGTMGGLGVHDYIVGDETVTPLDRAADELSERVVQLPNTFFLTSYPAAFGHVLPRPVVDPSSCDGGGGDACRGTILCDFNHLYKVTPDTFQSWVHVLEAVPDARLWLLRLPAEAEANLLAAAPTAVRDRIYFTDLFPLQGHLTAKQECDLFLDTFTFNAHGTAMDALWAGVPLLTLRGNSYQARVAASHLAALGLADDLVTDTADAFIARAVELASNRDQLNTLRSRLVDAARSTSRLFNTASWTADFEAAMRAVATVHRLGRPARHLVMPKRQDEAVDP